ncbi:MinD/ParA family protein [Nocardia sp. NPDC006630]|uniref:MinD/ParA family ATP-binding protein n=1 Tax=Nocardia sp. NPDC006630 TaxID=3157181 RepID=UPI00339ECBB7
MNRVPSTNDHEVGPAAARGGYDVFFAELMETEEAAGGGWQSTAGGRGHEPQGSAAAPANSAVAADQPDPVPPHPGVVGRPPNMPEPAPPMAAGQSRMDQSPGAPSWQVGSPTGPVQSREYVAPPSAPAPGFAAPQPVAQSAELAWSPGQVGRQESEQVQVLPIALTSSDLLAELAASRQAQLRSTAGMRGALNKVGFSLGLSPVEQRTEERRTRIRRQLTSTYQIAVINVKGGVGRTTTVAALGSTFADLRPDRVVAIDANPDFGDLPSRTGRHPYGLSLRDLAQATNVEAFSAVQSYTSINNADLAVIASPWTSAATEALSGQEYLKAVEVLRLHYNLLLIDCGTGVLDSSTGTVLQTSDAVVVVTPATVRGVTGAVATLEWMNTHGLHRLVAKTMVAIVYQHPAKPDVELGRIEELFEAAHRPTCVLPYDPHLAEGGEIDLRLLAKETALAFEELAAGLADAFPANVVPVRGDRGGWR